MLFGSVSFSTVLTILFTLLCLRAAFFLLLFFFVLHPESIEQFIQLLESLSCHLMTRTSSFNDSDDDGSSDDDENNPRWASAVIIEFST